jgi:hypothetical protein
MQANDNTSTNITTNNINDTFEKFKIHKNTMNQEIKSRKK